MVLELNISVKFVEIIAIGVEDHMRDILLNGAILMV